MELQRMIDYGETLIDLECAPEGDERVVADHDEIRAGAQWYNEHSVPVSTARLFIPDREPDATVRENERWWQLEDGTLIFLSASHGVIIAPGDEPPEIHPRRLSNVVQLHG